MLTKTIHHISPYHLINFSLLLWVGILLAIANHPVQSFLAPLIKSPFMYLSLMGTLMVLLIMTCYTFPFGSIYLFLNWCGVFKSDDVNRFFNKHQWFPKIIIVIDIIFIFDVLLALVAASLL